ncbi:uncharacterized protein BDCG_05391 [Blastomyces dermatitidis ER-3]|uniref:Uncharacterized protein n=3 Tax=Blastomyces TaxID=229219 RepID=A0A179V1C0_BLAGS|nr:uncharacterized protein BDBG_17923 [Blastomyces gilchristii SLH14081]XP_045277032.1 uncharacterized protein BDCG_05391 [Blastomyces dermatitidis ER-3]EGE86203.2 hypothetical protein BDDG_09148 [Blastomyces dermatitidis ATCC 18188]EQL29588.1 hypothetical protein BDFG_07814 [Blastomyces dermatitidis ATCC 26199]EEQ90271.2 hypothetical protein BDCG_05391 [Blastomyces dermatitidis ER-3]OAT13833.1 hypothetical protein BDBG_17923 [Blastomyces gilchristii SLH14081]
MADLPDPQATLQQINEGYKRVDHFCKTFNCPSHLFESFQQILLIPSSFASLPDFSTTELNATKQSAALPTAQMTNTATSYTHTSRHYLKVSSELLLLRKPMLGSLPGRLQ